MKRNRLLIYAVVLAFFVSALGITGCEPTGESDCVVMLGDSIFAMSGEETDRLEELSGQQWRQYYKNGAQLEGGSVIAADDIEDQLDDAIDDGAIRTIIMDGGGNDFLLGSGTVAEIEEELRDAWGRILGKARDAGVKNVIVQGYYETTDAAADELAVNERTMAWLPTQSAVYGITILTYNPNADPWFTTKNPTSYTVSDGIHPDTAASEQMAEMIWDLMVDNNIEQGDACPLTGRSGWRWAFQSILKSQ
jgi:lysophospholipase L1-like esterase